MKAKQTMFFALFEDIEQILQDIEKILDIRYYKSGLLDSAIIPTYDSIFDAPNVGVAISGDWNRIDRYIILKRVTTLNIREVPQRAGGVKFAVDPMINPKSIELKLGGTCQDKENVIVAGRIGTTSEESDSDELYKIFAKKIKKNFKRIGMFYVGKEAEEKLKIGWRLVTDEKSPKEFDLKIDK